MCNCVNLDLLNFGMIFPGYELYYINRHAAGVAAGSLTLQPIKKTPPHLFFNLNRGRDFVPIWVIEEHPESYSEFCTTLRDCMTTVPEALQWLQSDLGRNGVEVPTGETLCKAWLYKRLSNWFKDHSVEEATNQRGIPLMAQQEMLYRGYLNPITLAHWNPI